jgi:prevent-host-death family protein
VDGRRDRTPLRDLIRSVGDSRETLFVDGVAVLVFEEPHTVQDVDGRPAHDHVHAEVSPDPGGEVVSSDPKRIGIEDARVNFAEILMRTRYKRERFIISKHGEPLALLIPIDAIPTLQPATPLTLAQKKFGALARMVPADSKT